MRDKAQSSFEKHPVSCTPVLIENSLKFRVWIFAFIHSEHPIA